VEKVLVLVCNYVALDTIMIIQYRSKIPLGNRRKERLLLHHQSSENKALSLSLTYFQFDSVNLLKKEIRITVRISFPAFLTSYLWYTFYTNVSRGVMSRAGTFEDHLPVSGRSFSAVPELLINLAGRGRRRGGGEEGEEGEGEDSSQ
jgi:hypothetical protein